MTTTPTTPPAAPEEKPRRRKLLALGAGGLALGIGVTMTLAAWTDDENATGAFQSGTFNIQGSADGTTFSDNPAAPGLTVSFDDLATAMSPGDTTTAAYAVRLDPTADLSGDVVLSSSTGTGDIAGHLRYSIIQTSSFGAAASSGTTLVDDQPTSVATASDTLFSLDSSTPVYLIFQVTADSTLPQGVAGDLEWTFTGTSATPLS